MMVLLGLLGCSSAPRQPIVTTLQPSSPSLPPLLPIQQLPVHWTVRTTEDGQVWFSLTPQDYENLARNFAEITRWVTEAQGQLEYYRE